MRDRDRTGLVLLLLLGLWIVWAGVSMAEGGTVASPVYAVVDGYADGSSENNQPETWGDECVKVDSGFGQTFVLDRDYPLAVVKGGTLNTIFVDALVMETVWSDNNLNGVFDGSPRDKDISHIIFCPAPAPPETPVPPDQPSPPVPEPGVRVPLPPGAPQTGF